MPARRSVRSKGPYKSWRSARGTTFIDRRAFAVGRARGRPGYRTVARSRGWAGAKSETKYFDTFISARALPATTSWAGCETDPATFNTFCVPVKGTSINERVGRTIEIQKVKIRGSVRCPPQVNATATDPGSIVRLILFVDKQTNAAHVQAETVMDGPSAANSILCTQTFQNLDSMGRFHVLKDKYMSLSPPTLTWDGTNMEQTGTQRAFKMFHVFKPPLKVNFNATNGGSVADISDNSIHMIGRCTSDGVAPTLDFEARVSYKDL